jgi:hypothetical protein
VNGHRLQRLADLERAVADAAICVVAAEKPVHLMSDAECVEEWCRLCRLPIPPPPEPDDDERADILHAWRELTGR